jgi:opacity protein-like surface antigen
MQNIFKKLVFTSCAALMAVTASAQANLFSCDPCGCSPFYIGVFGGGGSASDPHINQSGTAFFVPPLGVDANGSFKRSNSAIGGAHLGYELNPICDCSGWVVTPAVEFEGYYLKRLGSTTRDLINIDISGRLEEHDFVDKLPMSSGVFLFNGVVAFTSPLTCNLNPYAGVGVGVAGIWVSGADSKQVNPLEPGVNHFNSRRNDTDWALAVQAKLGLRFNLSCNWRLFVEYRYLFIDSTNYKFGATDYPTHVPTTDWHVHVGSMSHNMGVIGIQYVL